jgi:hypothetical protein
MERVILHEEGSYFNIFYDKNNPVQIGVQNKTTDVKMFYFLTLKKGFNLRTDNDLNPRAWKTVFNLDKEEMYVVVYYDYNVNIYSVKYNSEIPKIKRLNEYVDFDYSQPFNIFLGHTGGGTSVVVKMLRYLGLHFGDDAGPMENRKSHESASITAIMKHINSETPIYIARNLFNQIWNVYNYKENRINCIKKPNLLHKTIKLGEVFPNCKIVSIMRKPNGFFSKTEGKIFNEKSEIDLIHYQRPLVEGTPMFHLDFNKFFTDYNYVNKLLRFLGSDNFLNNEQELEQLKNKINFDNRVLQ